MSVWNPPKSKPPREGLGCRQHICEVIAEILSGELWHTEDERRGIQQAGFCQVSRAQSHPEYSKNQCGVLEMLYKRMEQEVSASTDSYTS